MSQEIIKVLEYLGEKLGIAIDWTTENVLPYAEQLFKRYVTLKITYASIGTVIGIALAVTAIVLGVKVLKAYIEMKKTETSNTFWYISKTSLYTDWDFTAAGAIATILVAICVFAAIPTFICSVHTLIEWIIIPEIPFAKEIASLLGTTM
jgi:hypothetical protein